MTERFNLLLYTFEEPHETGAASFIQLVDTGICQHLSEHLAYLILQDQVDAVAVQLRMAGQDLLCPCGVLLQGFGVLLGIKTACSLCYGSR